MLRFTPLLLLLPAVAFGQTAEVVTKLEAKLDAERAAQRNEDVEVLRRLLNKACGLPDKASVALLKDVSESGLSDAVKRVAGVGPFDGVHLPNAGIVFTLHVPAGAPKTTADGRLGLNSSCNGCHISTKSPAPSSLVPTSRPDAPNGDSLLSDWDRVKQDVRGEKPKPADKPKESKPKAAVCEPGDLQNVIAGVLAANGKNVRHLPAAEGITVVVTFDELAAGGPGALADYAKIELATTPPPSRPGFTPAEVKSLTLGDLHMKQGKYDVAAAAYLVALARFTDKQFKMTAPPNLTAEQRNQYAEEFQKGVREAMTNFSKALVMTDKADAAKKALELATEFVVLEVTTPTAKATGPAKLIVSVTKADMDATKDAAGVRKAVKVETPSEPKK
jgi:hypothetical protein